MRCETGNSLGSGDFPGKPVALPGSIWPAGAGLTGTTSPVFGRMIEFGYCDGLGVIAVVVGLEAAASVDDVRSASGRRPAANPPSAGSFDGACDASLERFASVAVGDCSKLIHWSRRR